MIIKHLVVFFLCLIVSIFALAQNVEEFQSYSALKDSSERKLSFNFEMTSFVKNNEYDNSFTKGFTGIGTFVKPTIQYYFTNSTKVNLGGYFLKYSGVKSFSEVTPIISVQQKINKQFELIIGTLYGALNHKIKEPLYRFDHYYQNNIENGLQLLHKSKHIQSDLWLNWKRFIFQNDPFQEELEGGSVTDFKFSKKKWIFNFPLQLLMAHKGGQIDSSPNLAISIFNGVTGIEIGRKLNKERSVVLEPLFYVYQGLDLPLTGVNSRLFDSGNAFSLKIKYKGKSVNASLGYWNANKFIAPKGEYLYMSVSENNPTFSQVNRALLTGKINFIKTISESVKLSFRTDAYFDIQNSDLSFSNGLYLIINENFFLKKIRKIK